MDNSQNNLGRNLPIDSVFPSRTNPRKRFDEKKLEEMAASISIKGVIQPIVVRPHPENPLEHFEIVAGESRWRASKLANMETIPGVVRELTDLEALELQVMENLHRVDLHPLEEALGFKELLAKSQTEDLVGFTVEDMAAKLGISKTHIYGALKLTELCTYAQDKFLAGKFGRETAILIARIPGTKLQESATREIVGSEEAEPMSFRKAKEHIHARYTLKLKSAPFRLAAWVVDLIPDAGSCKTCPKRSGNTPELFSDIESADVCTDPDCYTAKCEAHKAKSEIAKVPEENADVRTPQAETSMLQAETPASTPPATFQTAPQYEQEKSRRHTLMQEETESREKIFGVMCDSINEYGGLKEFPITCLLEVLIEKQFEQLYPEGRELVQGAYGYNGIDDADFLQGMVAQPTTNANLLKFLFLIMAAQGTDVDWNFSEDTVDEPEDMMFLMYSLGLTASEILKEEAENLNPAGRNKGTEFGEATVQTKKDFETPTTPLPATQVNNTPEISQNDLPAAPAKTLPPKLQAIKDKELARRARRAKPQQQKESASADVQTGAAAATQTSEAANA